MLVEGYQSCKQCGFEFNIDNDLKHGLCRSCELSILWNQFIIALCDALGISCFVRWLAKKI